MRRLGRKLNKSPELQIMSTHVVVVGTVVVLSGGARVVVFGATVDVVVKISGITGRTFSLSSEGAAKNEIKCK